MRWFVAFDATSPRSQTIFTSFASGDFGTKLVHAYVELLEKFPTLHVPDVGMDYFRMCIEPMGDNWRRLVLPTQHFTWIMFTLLAVNQEQWPQEIARLKSLKTACYECTDAEFSSILLDLDSMEDSDSESLVRLRFFLEDVAAMSPISSDLVECLHGYSQHLLHRWRGCKPSDPVAQERTLWALILRSYAKLREYLWDKHGDVNFGHRIHKYGKKSSNQYTVVLPESERLQKKASDKMPLSREKLESMLESGLRMKAPRKLCGAMAKLIHFISICTISAQLKSFDFSPNTLLLGFYLRKKSWLHPSRANCINDFCQRRHR